MPSIVDKNSVRKICVDDFAFRKRYTYGTVMIDIETHRIVDILESRDTKLVENWLRTYPNIELISRDGAQTYASASTNAHPNAIQVSDRFHLLKNLSEAVELYIRKVFPARVDIPSIDEINWQEFEILYNTANRNERILFAKKKINEGYSVSDIALLLHSSNKTVQKYVEMSEDDIPASRITTRERQHLEEIERKRNAINEVRQLKAKGYSISEIARRTCHTPKTVRIYLDPNCPVSNAGYDARKHGKLHNYEKEVISLRAKGVTYSKIHEIICAKGYDGTVASLRVFMQKERTHIKSNMENATPQATAYVSRKTICQLIYKNIEKVKNITQEQYNEVLKRYPVLGKLYHLLKEFHRIIFTHKVDEFDFWMKEALELKIDEITSYVRGLEADLEAVRNSIIYQHNNGLAEGSVNKIKLIKRTMYGRNSFHMLRAKVLFHEQFHCEFN